MNGTDEQYVQIILDAIRVCAQYRPKFGQGAKGGGLTLEQFQGISKNASWIVIDGESGNSLACR